MEIFYAYHVVTERPMHLGQHILFDDSHHSGVYERVTKHLETVNDIYQNPEKYEGIELEYPVAVALRELALEEVRQKKYPNYPSRMGCLYVSETLQESVNWADYFISLGRPTFQIVKVKVSGKRFMGDATKCFDGVTRKEENLRLAERYWENGPNPPEEPPINEFLVGGDIEIVEIVREFSWLDSKISRVLTHWNMSGCQIRRIYDTAWQIGDAYVLKVYQDTEMLERNLKMLHILGEMNIPVAQVVPTCDNTQYVSQDNAHYFLSKKLPGSNITQINGYKNMADIALRMGEIIARLHAAFKKCDTIEGLWNNSLLDEMNGWVKENLERNGWCCLSREEYEKTVSQLADIYDQLPVQLIHRDIHFGNFLFADGVFSGYIDFDLSQRNIRIFDICYFLLGLLSAEEGLEIKPLNTDQHSITGSVCDMQEDENVKMTEEAWFASLRNIFTGYESILELSPAEKEAVPYVMECIELLFAAYFEGINDSHCAKDAYGIYEFVKKQENRIRTCIP